MLRALQRDGWQERRTTGSHVQLRHPTKPGRVTGARHARIILNPKTVATILEQAGLTADDLRELL